MRCSRSVLFRFYAIPCFTGTFKVQCCIRTCSINVLACLDIKSDLNALAHLALLVLLIIWLSASSMVPYVGLCTTYTVKIERCYMEGK